MTKQSLIGVTCLIRVTCDATTYTTISHHYHYHFTPVTGTNSALGEISVLDFTWFLGVQIAPMGVHLTQGSILPRPTLLFSNI